MIAVPILMGYALNLTETTETDYRATGDVVNVTPLLQNGVGYSYAHADILDINTKMLQGTTRIIPNYKTVNQIISSYPTYHTNNVNTTYPSGYSDVLTTLVNLYEVFIYNPSNGSMNIVVNYNNGGVAATQSYSNVYSVYYEGGTVYVKSYVNVGGWFVDQTTVGIVNDAFRIDYSHSGSYSANVDRMYTLTSGTGYYADISSGFFMNHFGIVGDPSIPDSYKNSNLTNLDLPANPKNVLLTMDLGSLSGDFTIEVGAKRILMDCTIDGGGLIHWEAYRFLTDGGGTRGSKICDLYYDNSRASNTYQFFADDSGFEFRYVGDWPTIIGPANYYLKYQYDWSDFSNGSLNIANIGIRGIGPRMRVDDSEYRAFEYPIIQNCTYDPSQFKTIPSTTISNPTIYGDSITFGGITYAVKDGNITLGSHEIPVKGLVLSSIPTVGGYDNKIGNTVVSTTATPSTITFNGTWSASISTSSMEYYTYTHTEWNAGKFAWDGMDQNFLIVGLITCLGVFVALGIYARKSRSGGIIPLMIVVGGAAMVFFVML